MPEEPNISALSLAILGLISQKPRSGYDVKKTFATTPMGVFSRSPGAIYPALERLEKSGLLEGKVENSNTLRPRKVYALTSKGVEALRRELGRSVTHEDVVWRRDVLMLRFVFMEWIIDRDGTLRFLREFAARTEAYLASLEQQRREYGDDHPMHGRWALERGIEDYRADAQWAKRVLDELQTDQSLVETTTNKRGERQ